MKKQSELRLILSSFNEKQESVLDYIEASQKVSTLTSTIDTMKKTILQLESELEALHIISNDMYAEIEGREPLVKEESKC